MATKKVLFILLMTDIAIFIGFLLSKWILRINHLAYRNIINYSVFTALVIITLVLSIFVIVFLLKRASQKGGWPAIRILSGAGIAAMLLIISFASLSIFIRSVFSYQPEHVVEKNGHTMVARVDSFLQVEVRYYDYVNAFVRGNKMLIYEDYGNGGYDPFERDKMPKVKRRTKNFSSNID